MLTYNLVLQGCTCDDELLGFLRGAGARTPEIALRGGNEPDPVLLLHFLLEPEWSDAFVISGGWVRSAIQDYGFCSFLFSH